MLKLSNRILVTFLLVIAVSFLCNAQQESQYTQFMYNKLTYNPAFAGVRGLPSVTALYRKQWMGFEGAPVSKLISFDAPLFGDKVGFGLNVSQQTLGIQNNWLANMAYSYHIKVSDKSSFRFGLQASMKFQGIDFADPGVYIRDINDPSTVPDKTTSDVFANFGAGIYFTYDNTYFGVSVPYFYPGEIGFNKNSNLDAVAKTSSHYYAMAGTMLPLGQKLHLKPSALVKYVQNAPLDADLNLTLVVDLKFNLGVSYRIGGDGSGDSVDLLAMYQHNQIGLGLAYDYSLSSLQDHNDGSIEAIIRYDFLKEREDMANPRFFFK